MHVMIIDCFPQSCVQAFNYRVWWLYLQTPPQCSSPSSPSSPSSTSSPCHTYVGIGAPQRIPPPPPPPSPCTSFFFLPCVYTHIYYLHVVTDTIILGSLYHPLLNYLILICNTHEHVHVHTYQHTHTHQSV